jgi:hypothetical protein
MSHSASPASAAGMIRAFGLRDDARALEKAAGIASGLDCHALANSLRRLADARRAEARALTRVSESDTKE